MRTALRDPCDVAGMIAARRLLANADIDNNAGTSQPVVTLPRDLRIRVFDGADDVLCRRGEQAFQFDFIG